MDGRLETQKADRVKLKKLKRSIRYSFDGKEWVPFFEGTEQEVTNTWIMMRAGFCNDDLVAIIHKYNQNKGEV